VHRAELHSGEPVVVKVQYPGVADTVRQDVKNIKALLRVFTGIARDVMRQDVDRDEVAAELEARLHEELDYLNEASNLERFRILLADDDEVMIPRLHRELTTRRVITMEYLDGYPIQDIMAPGVDREMQDWVAIKLYGLLWRQVLEFGVLHTDPHPGNYLVTHHPRLGILDFGSVRVFEPEICRGYGRLARALLANDDREIAGAMLDLGFMSPGDDPQPLVAMIHIMCEPLVRDEPFDPREFDIMERAGRVAQLALAHRIFKTPAHQVFLMRALLGTDAYLKAFGTVRNWHRIFQQIVDVIPAAANDASAPPA
jgi:predicted unusual protein kinase regulating ubiquinone biosynthesis (AarF/ABC1/UbiB family)